MSERIVITLYTMGGAAIVERQQRDIAGRGYDTSRRTVSSKELHPVFMALVMAVEKERAATEREALREKLQMQLAEFDALDKSEGRNQVPGMPSALCHACGLGYQCRKEGCPNKGLYAPSFGVPLGDAT